jgi:hypothetical protein
LQSLDRKFISRQLEWQGVQTKSLLKNQWPWTGLTFNICKVRKFKAWAEKLNSMKVLISIKHLNSELKATVPSTPTYLISPSIFLLFRTTLPTNKVI